MAPVAGGITDRQEDPLALAFRPGQGLFSPGLLIDRIKGLLEPIGALLIHLMIGFFTGRRALCYVPLESDSIYFR
jgi:hypothetical protein